MGIAMVPSACLFFNSCSGSSNEAMDMELFDDKNPPASLDTLKITVVYDNYSYAPGMFTDWGFACLLQGLQQTLLFDSGRIASTFMSNLNKLGIDHQRIDTAIISHDHHDHIGGLPKLAQTRPGMQVYLHASFSSGYKKRLRGRNAKVVEMGPPGIICSHAASTGEMRSRVKNEHSLLVRTDQGAIVITGCAHPGILDIVHRARSLAGQDILLVMGGFHLLYDSAKSIRKIIDGFQQAGVRYVAPSHCSGEETRKLFAEAYGHRFIRSGAGRVINAEVFDRHSQAV
jgi:7,8-dihydropterin-6-yl-methyl-4-(beta-D-ribofuranosyl)aminobenzene 5'-phosphate synthase